MRFFVVTVDTGIVKTEEKTEALKTIHARATVDGVACLYQVKKHKFHKENRQSVLERGLTQVHYHAKNLGATVRFTPTHNKARKKSKLHEKQLSLWA